MQLMEQYGVDVLIARSPANITYFTDYHCWLNGLFKQYMIAPGDSNDLSQFYAVFARNGESALVLEQFMGVNAAEISSDHLYLYGKGSPGQLLPPRDGSKRNSAADQPYLRATETHPESVDALAAFIRRLGLTDGRIALEKEALPHLEYEQIKATLPAATLLDGSNLMRLIRMVKSSEEQARMVRAAEIAEIAGAEALAMAQVGQSLQEMVQHYRARAAGMGADFEHFAYTIGGHGLATEPEYKLTGEDFVMVDWGCIYRQYFSDTGTSLMMRRPQPGELEYFKAIRESVEDAVAIMRPGVLASHVQKQMTDALQRYGIEGQFPHGHGLGIDVRDYPILVPDNGLRIKDDCVDLASDLPLEQDMVLNLESAVFLPQYGAWHTEQTFLVTHDGAQPLLPQQRSEPVIVQ